MSMIMCMASMLLGALIFASGIAFERMPKYAKSRDAGEKSVSEAESELARQWENLLGYDGNEQEEELCE